MYFGSAAMWEMVSGAELIMKLSYIVPIVFGVFWVALLIRMIMDKKQKKKDDRLTKLMLRFVTMLALMTVVFELWLRLDRHWYERQWLLIVLELPTLLAWLLYRRYPKYGIVIMLVMLIVVLVIALPVAMGNFGELH